MSGFDEPWKQSWAREADKVKALTESLRYTVKERETWRQRAEEAEECIVWVKCDDPEHERLAAAESRAEQMERVVEAARTVELAWAGWIFPNHAEPHLLEGVDDAVFALTDALAALPSPESEQ
jgi:hypothetical protein